MATTGRPRRGRLILAVASGIGCLSLMAAAQADDPKDMRRTVSVSGIGKVSARPDLAEVEVGVVTQAATAREALQANNRAMEGLQKILQERGVASKDIRTVHIQVMPQYNQRPPQVMRGDQAVEFIPRIVAYRVENSVRITARQLDALGPLLDALVEGGANQIRGISFRVEKAEDLLNQARTRAVEEARQKANLLAGAAGVGLGEPLKIEEHAGVIPPPPRMFNAGPMMAGAAAMPVSPGEQELSASVTIMYELVPRK